MCGNRRDVGEIGLTADDCGAGALEKKVEKTKSGVACAFRPCQHATNLNDINRLMATHAKQNTGRN